LEAKSVGKSASLDLTCTLAIRFCISSSRRADSSSSFCFCGSSGRPFSAKKSTSATAAVEVIERYMGPSFRWRFVELPELVNQPSASL
jgi:hypothetical protein